MIDLPQIVETYCVRWRLFRNHCFVDLLFWNRLLVKVTTKYNELSFYNLTLNLNQTCFNPTHSLNRCTHNTDTHYTDTHYIDTHYALHLYTILKSVLNILHLYTLHILHIYSNLLAQSYEVTFRKYVYIQLVAVNLSSGQDFQMLIWSRLILNLLSYELFITSSWQDQG